MEATAFDDLFDDPVMETGKVPSSVLDMIVYHGSDTAQSLSGCQPHMDKGLFTIIAADTTEGLQVGERLTNVCAEYKLGEHVYSSTS